MPASALLLLKSDLPQIFASKKNHLPFSGIVVAPHLDVRSLVVLDLRLDLDDLQSSEALAWLLRPDCSIDSAVVVAAVVASCELLELLPAFAVVAVGLDVVQLDVVGLAVVEDWAAAVVDLVAADPAVAGLVVFVFVVAVVIVVVEVAAVAVELAAVVGAVAVAVAEVVAAAEWLDFAVALDAATAAVVVAALVAAAVVAVAVAVAVAVVVVAFAFEPADWLGAEQPQELVDLVHSVLELEGSFVEQAGLV